MDGDWISHGKVRARESEGAVEVVVDGLTTQTKYYKPLVYEFFRKAWRGARPSTEPDPPCLSERAQAALTRRRCQ